MKRSLTILKDLLLTVGVLTACFLLSLLFQYHFGIAEHITTIFVFAVFIVSLFTNGYIYGIASAVVGTVIVNVVFTFPYFNISVQLPANLIAAVAMITMSAMTSALVTKLKKHEAAKAESQKERMRANLLRAVSHDLRTPLTTIYGSASVLMENRDSMTQEQQQTILQGIKEDSDWLIRMVENLLSVTRLDSGRVKIVKTPTVLEELVDAVLMKFKHRYPNVVVRIDIPDEILVIPMDAILIEQVLINLFENAVHHAYGMTHIRFRVFTLGKRAVFELEDDGCGIPPERLPYIFSGYFDDQRDMYDSRTHNAGIGLSVCSTIIKAHGGDICAENKKQGGAIIRFMLHTEETTDGE